MRVVFANTFDSRGGAARAAFRLFTGVHRLPGVEAVMAVQEKRTTHPGVVAPSWGLGADTASRLDARGLKAAHPDRVRTPFSVNRFPGRGASLVRGQRPDLAHLHWLHCGFLRIESLARLAVPLVWTIHDMWAFTGVCHYNQGCDNYLDGCGRCPLLASDDPNDISARVFRRKRAVYPRLDLTVVSPSNWLAGLARQSRLLSGTRVEVIPNGIDTDFFRPMDKTEARRLLGLPEDATLILFGADHAMDDARKGGGLLAEALSSTGLRRAELAVFGSDAPRGPSSLPLKTHWLGRITEDARLVAAYSAADLFVAPSLQENLSNTVMESLACGTPVAAFAIGGMADLVTSGENGMLADATRGGAGLGRVLETLLADPQRLAAMGKAARDTAEARFELGRVARRYETLYRSVLASAGK